MKASRYLAAAINPHHGDIALLVCSYITGLIDSGSYNAWSVFMGMQTGNTVFLGLGAASLPEGKPIGWLKSLVAITSFLIGSFLTYRIGSWFGPLRRRTLFVSFALQASSIWIAAALVTASVIPEDPNSTRILIAIPFIAWQFGAQIATSRFLGFAEIPTTVLTSLYYAIASDDLLLAAQNAKRNRRVASVVFLLSGAISGGWISRSEAGLAGVLWAGGGLKLLLGLAWLFFPDGEKAGAAV
ncbi:MAG: hypothetical protein M1829_005596 [Trizodia sp. TS-e1964]|nr:MAG: hypothetical protein M1829_005596 [Trizodia sp. TS-e1964]